MAVLDVEINGNPSGLNNALNSAESGLNSFSRNGQRSIQSLRLQLQGYQQTASRATDPAILARYNRRIQETQAEITRLGNVGREGFDALGNAINRSNSGIGTAYSSLRELANILPGIGVAGLIGFAVGPLIEYGSQLDILGGKLNRFGKEKAIDLEIQKDAIKSYAEESTRVKVLASIITDATLSTVKRSNAVSEYNKLADKANQIDVSTINNSTLVEALISRQINLIRQRGLARAAESVIAQKAEAVFSKQLEIDTKYSRYSDSAVSENEKRAEDAIKKQAKITKTTAASKDELLAVSMLPDADIQKIASQNKKFAVLLDKGTLQILKEVTSRRDQLKKIRGNEGGGYAGLQVMLDELKVANEELERATNAGSKYIKDATIKPEKESAKSGNIKSLPEILQNLNKALEKTEVQFASTFGDRNKAKIAAYQAAIDSATDSFGRQSKAVADLIAEQQKLFQLTPSKEVSANTGINNPAIDSKGKSTLVVDLKRAEIPDLIDPKQVKVAKDLNKELTRSVKKFSSDFYDTITSLNTQTDQTFKGIFSNLVSGLNSSLSSVFLNKFQEKLTSVFKISTDKLGEGLTNALAGAGLLGGVVSGITPKTSSVGQGLGGALSGAATGAIAGTVIPGLGTLAGGIIGGVVGAIGGLFGAGRARKQEEMQKKQLEEQEKQTRLLERQNALAYTSSIIGRQTTMGVVTGVEVNEFGQITTKISGNDLAIVLDRANGSRQRGV